MDLDYYTTNIGRNTLYNQQSNNSFQDVSTPAGVENTYSIPPDSFFTTGWGTAFLDIDNDTDLDLYISNGLIPAATFIQTEENDPNMLYLNNADGTFTNIADTLGVDSDLVNRGLAYADYDNDGDLDLLVGTLEPYSPIPPKNVLLYRNETQNSNNWLQVKLEGIITNRDAFGSQIDIYVGGKSWVHEISGGCSHLSQHSSIAHFGLGQDTLVDSLRVRWLSGNVETFHDIAANQVVQIIEDTTTPIINTIISNDYQGTVDSGRVQLVNINTQEVDSHWLRAYPNPSQGFLQLDYRIGSQAATTLELYNNLGQLILRKNLGASSDAIQYYQLNLEQLPVGQYHLRLRTKTESWSTRILLQD